MTPTLEALFERARDTTLDEAEDSHEWWDVILKLRRDADPEVYRRAADLCCSTVAVDRLCGVTILAQFGVTHTQSNPYAVEICALFCSLVETEPTTQVTHAILSAFGHLGQHKAIPYLLSYAQSPDWTVRDRVAIALERFRQDEAATRCLVALSSDPVASVRDWATFALAGMNGPDYPGVVDALKARVNDPDPGTRKEAREGLRARGVHL